MAKRMTKLRLLSALRAFRDDHRGTITVETVLVLPMLIWAYLGIYVFFDAFAKITLSSKSTYTIADMLSRQREEVDTQFLDNSRDLFDWLSHSTDTAIRISSISWNETDKAYKVAWSYAAGGKAVQTNATINDYADKIPILPEGDYLIVVETWLDYTPLFLNYLDPFTFTEFTVTRPRFMPKLEYTG